METPPNCGLVSARFAGGVEGGRSQIVANAVSIRTDAVSRLAKASDGFAKRRACGKPEDPGYVGAGQIAIIREGDDWEKQFYCDLFGQMGRCAVGCDESNQVVAIGKINQIRGRFSPGGF